MVSELTIQSNATNRTTPAQHDPTVVARVAGRWHWHTGTTHARLRKRILIVCRLFGRCLSNVSLESLPLKGLNNYLVHTLKEYLVSHYTTLLSTVHRA